MLSLTTTHHLDLLTLPLPYLCPLHRLPPDGAPAYAPFDALHPKLPHPLTPQNPLNRVTDGQLPFQNYPAHCRDGGHGQQGEMPVLVEGERRVEDGEQLTEVWILQN